MSVGVAEIVGVGIGVICMTGNVLALERSPFAYAMPIVSAIAEARKNRGIRVMRAILPAARS